ncbi:hypothetical protein EJ05DRAFT_391150 [Pseudovirgaria hyperparasitica]|uniref:Rhodopsin domain-containing protein n=1 Tax=Pseudovirgaria hyperparasitica TaxID=470096 RepID=A0A6A6W5P3_9PEZI|nr:uncharacterized protein EJ05DRAFT_391150 [Pseudovirgaria hyperparasitica]KAF2757489.1 hypothetical protein EJ05DRAFT_391150 [Pseudovirgaria hyperparasitica]
MDPSMLPPPVNPSDPGKGPLIIGTTWMLTGLCIPVIAFRFYVRSRAPSSPGLDDWIMLAATVLQITAQAFITVSYSYGMGKHDLDLTYNQLVNILKWVWFNIVPGILVSILARISITILLIRIFNRKSWLKVYLIIFTILQSIGGIMVIIIIFAQSDPVEALWNPLIPAKRWNPNIQLYSSYLVQSMFSFSDITYTFFPIAIIWKLQMPLKKKIGLATIMAFSLVTALASIMKTVLSQPPTGEQTDAQYHAVQSLPWAVAEQCLVIILGSVPTFASLIMRINLASIRSFGSSIFSKSKEKFSATSSQDSYLALGVRPTSGRFGGTRSDSPAPLDSVHHNNSSHKDIVHTDGYAVSSVGDGR